jgi:RNA methyltransferase, TrmH family
MAPLGAEHPVVQQLRRLSRRRSSRLADGLFVIDGPVLVADAHRAGVDLRVVVVDVDAPAPVSALADELRAGGVEVRSLAAGIIDRAVDTVTCQGIAAVATRVAPTQPTLGAEGGPPPLVPVLAGVADPGNAGTIMRSAEAAGASAVWATVGTVDLFAPKTVRASAGAVFHLPVVDGLDAAVAIDHLRAAGASILGTVARGGIPPEHADLSGPVALVLGNEAHGLEPIWRDGVDEWLTIPMVGRAESLNVAMAGTLVCFEAARQRRLAE